MTRLPDPIVRPPDAISRPAGQTGLRDQFGRVARDLRVSVTDRCNLRCTYCMPAEGLPWMPKAEMLTDEEMLRLIGLFVRDGVTQVRLTGGEPLLRRSLVELVAGIAALEPRPRIAMTTNGVEPRARRPGPGHRRPGPGQRQPRHDRLRDLHETHETGPDRRRRARPQGCGGCRPRPRSRSTPSPCAASTTTPWRTCCSGAWTVATSCASSSRCRSMPSTRGTAATW